jgi:hypothetical protein
MRRGAAAVVLVALLAAALSACASGAMRADVNVEIGASSLHLSQSTYDRQGAISFNVDNQSGQYRDLLIARFNHVASVPLTATGTVDVSRLSMADQIDVLAPGRYHVLSPDLTPGTYLFVSMAVPKVRAGPPIVGNQRYVAQVAGVGPYQPRMSARFVVS